VERFSIGFGPAIFKWRGKDNIEYRVSWFPLGGYVLLPQLADLGAIEGESQNDPTKLPPVSYATRMIVFVAGATCNIIFAFLLATIVWIIGQPVPSEITSTTVAEVLPTLTTADEKVVPSPASEAGLRVGDVIVAIDGNAVNTFEDIREHLALSSGWNKQGERETVFRIRRGAETTDLRMRPVLGGDEKLRQVGFRPAIKFVVDQVVAGSVSEKAGFQSGDQIVEVEGKPIFTRTQMSEAFRAGLGKPTAMTVRRGTESLVLNVVLPKQPETDLGLVLKAGFSYVHPTPFRQIWENVTRTFRTLWSLINPRSDIGFSHMSGPIGIIDNFVAVSRGDLRLVLWFTILVNVNLAIFNLLPMPVLDGGHMLFATLGRLRGRPLPPSFVQTAHSVFLLLLFSMVLYVSVFDVRRKVREVQADRTAEAAAAAEQKKAPAAGK
jgi:regulator of sigma E protease